MVEPVSHSAGKTRTLRTGPESSTALGGRATGSVTQNADASAVAGASEKVAISSAAMALPDQLKAGPPVEIETVNRIREAIAENRYPIDLKAITDSLFQSFLEISR